MKKIILTLIFAILPLGAISCGENHDHDHDGHDHNKSGE